MSLNDFHNPDFIVSLTLKLFLCLQVISNLEYLYIHNEFIAPRIYSWKILKLRKNQIGDRLFNKLDFLLDYPIITILLCTSTVSSAILFFQETGSLRTLLFLLIFLLNIVFNYRNSIGHDAADHLAGILNVCLALLVIFPGSAKVQTATFIFISFVTVLCYFTAGIAKVKSPEWTGGSAIYRFLNTKMQGNVLLASYIKKLKTDGNKALTWAMIGWQISFAFVFILPVQIFYFYILLGLLFHFINAVIFGFNRFFLAFTACYPSLLFVKLVLLPN